MLVEGLCRRLIERFSFRFESGGELEILVCELGSDMMLVEPGELKSTEVTQYETVQGVSSIYRNLKLVS